MHVNLETQQWWYCMRNKIEMKYDKGAIACENKLVRVIKWWVSRPDLELKYDEKNLDVKKYLNVIG